MDLLLLFPVPSPATVRSLPLLTSAQAHVQQRHCGRDRENDVYAPYVAYELEQWIVRHDLMAQRTLHAVDPADLLW